MTIVWGQSLWVVFRFVVFRQREQFEIIPVGLGSCSRVHFIEGSYHNYCGR